MESKKLENDIAVKQANKLIESIYKMEVNEHKLLLLATKKVNELELSNQPFDERTRIVISSSEFAKQYGVSRQSAFEIIVEAKKSIYGREFEYLHLDEKTGDLVPMYSRWFQTRGADSGKGEISFMFASAVIPLIYLVENEYTLLDLTEIGKLKSKYAVRLYKYLMRWVNAPYRNKIDLPKLRAIFGVEKDEYSDWRDFKKRVLDIAVKQVQAGTGFKDLTAQTYKTGKTVSHISFHYTKYSNFLIRNSKKVIESGEDKAPDKYVVHFMSDGQIETFSKSLALKASNTREYPQFADLGKLVEGGQGWEVLAERIAKDFKKGNFTPYLEYLQLAGFKPTKLNKALPSPDNEDPAPEGQTDEGDKGESKTPFTLSDPLYARYVANGGKMTKDQIIEIAMAENITPVKVIQKEGINIFAGAGVAG